MPTDTCTDMKIREDVVNGQVAATLATLQVHGFNVLEASEFIRRAAESVESHRRRESQWEKDEDKLNLHPFCILLRSF